jgi:hypothetical protein
VKTACVSSAVIARPLREILNVTWDYFDIQNGYI